MDSGGSTPSGRTSSWAARRASEGFIGLPLAAPLPLGTDGPLTGTGGAFAAPDLMNADLAGSGFTGAVFMDADFTGAGFTGGVFMDAGFTGRVFMDAGFTGAVFMDADFTGTGFTGADFAGTGRAGGFTAAFGFAAFPLGFAAGRAGFAGRDPGRTVLPCAAVLLREVAMRPLSSGVKPA